MTIALKGQVVSPGDATVVELRAASAVASVGSRLSPEGDVSLPGLAFVHVGWIIVDVPVLDGLLTWRRLMLRRVFRSGDDGWLGAGHTGCLSITDRLRILAVRILFNVRHLIRPSA